MESISNQALDSGESVKSLQVESYDGHEFCDDELSQNSSLCLGAVGETMKESFEDTYIGRCCGAIHWNGVQV